MWAAEGYMGPRGLYGPQTAMWAPEGYMGLRGLYGPQTAMWAPEGYMDPKGLSAFLYESQIIHPLAKTLGRDADSNCATVSCAIQSVATGQCCIETFCGNQQTDRAVLL